MATLYEAFGYVECGRCGGSGRYSYNQIDGSRCYGCNGTGKQFTERGKAAYDYYAASLEKEARVLEPGDKIRDDVSGRWFTVESIELTDSGKLNIDTSGYGFHGYDPGTRFRIAHTAEEKAAKIEQALSYAEGQRTNAPAPVAAGAPPAAAGGDRHAKARLTATTAPGHITPALRSMTMTNGTQNGTVAQYDTGAKLLKLEAVVVRTGYCYAVIAGGETVNVTRYVAQMLLRVAEQGGNSVRVPAGFFGPRIFWGRAHVYRPTARTEAARAGQDWREIEIREVA